MCVCVCVCVCVAKHTGLRVQLVYQKMYDCSRREKKFLKGLFNAQKYILKVKMIKRTTLLSSACNLSRKRIIL
jgi:hypothetical protein